MNLVVNTNTFFCAMRRSFSILILCFLILLMAGAPLSCQAASGQNLRSSIQYSGPDIRSGTVLQLRMDSTLSSATARTGETFTMTVMEPVIVNGQIAIAQGTKAQGHVTNVEPARRNETGTISVEFDRLVFANGQSIPIDGFLMSTDPNVSNQIDEEGRTTGSSTTKRNIIFVGGGAGIGAVIGALVGGGKGAAIGAGAGAGAGILGALFSKGHEAQVKTGDTFNYELTRSLRMSDIDSGYNSTDTGSQNSGGYGQTQQEYTDLEFIKLAQVQLRDRNYYGSAIDGRFSASTRSAIKNFQRDKRLEQTSRLDLQTAQALGLVDNNGNINGNNNGNNNNDQNSRLVRVVEAKAYRQSDRSIRVGMLTEVNSGGWNIFGDYEIRNGQMEVWARGTPPTGYASQGNSRKNLDVISREDVSRIRTVVVHSDSRDWTIAVGSSSQSDNGSSGMSLASSLKLQADRMLATVRSQFRTNGRTRRSSIWQLNENEANLYSSLAALAASTQFYAELVDARSSDEAQRGAAEVIIRNARRVSRMMQRGGRSTDRIQRDFDAYESGIKQLTDQYQFTNGNEEAWR